MHILIYFFFSVAAFILTPLLAFSEIKQVSIFWVPGMCNEKCGSLLGDKFKAMKEVESVNVNSASGVATLKWKKGSQFSYHQVKGTLQMVGVGENNVKVSVRGKVKDEGRDVALYSLDDNTRFVLISPLPPTKDQFTPAPSGYFMVLNKDVKDRILAEAKQGKIMVAEGPLYQPWTSPPMRLILDKVQIEKKE